MSHRQKSAKWQRVIWSTFSWPCVATSWLCWLSGKLHSVKTSTESGQDVLKLGTKSNRNTEMCCFNTLVWVQKDAFLRVFNVGLTITTIVHLTSGSVDFRIFGLILHKVNLLASLMLTHNRESCSIALASLTAVLVLCNAAVGGQSVFLLHFWDIQGAKRGQEETITWHKDGGGRRK